MALAAFGLWQLIIIVVFLGICIVFPVIAMVDILKHRFRGSQKLTWVIGVLLFNILGAILYFIIGRKQRLPDDKSS